MKDYVTYECQCGVTHHMPILLGSPSGWGIIGTECGSTHLCPDCVTSLSKQPATQAPIKRKKDDSPKITENAEDIIAERQKTHGDYDSFAHTFIKLLETVMQGPHWQTLDPVQKTSLIMGQFKIARVLNTKDNHVDNWLDISGYAALAERHIQCAEMSKEPPKSTPNEAPYKLAKKPEAETDQNDG